MGWELLLPIRRQGTTKFGLLEKLSARDSSQLTRRSTAPLTYIQRHLISRPPFGVSRQAATGGQPRCFEPHQGRAACDLQLAPIAPVSLLMRWRSLRWSGCGGRRHGRK
jgi:hypothetical protein